MPAITQLHNGQGHVMRKLLGGSSCLAVIPTGGGKSLLWLLFTTIAATRGSALKPLCVVVVPYKSLILNHKEASKPWFQDCEVVTSEDQEQIVRDNINQASVVYMTPEKYVKSTSFRNFINSQRSRVQLVVYDEVHLLQESSTFRPDMTECVQTLAKEFPDTIRLALTATSEVAQVPALLQSASMPSNTCVTRLSCDRSNCHIQIVPLLDSKTKSKETKFDQDALDMFRRFNVPELPQTIIFVISKKEAVNLCNHLQSLCGPSSTVQADQISFFHADLDSSERSDRMRGFGSRALIVMVSTTAFGTGVNFPSIRIIIHYTIPPNLVEFLQNIGRGGRDGARYECIMYYSYKNVHECGGVWAQGAGLQSGFWARYIEVVKYILSTKCRRAFIIPYFDTAYNPDIVCKQCDNCHLEEVSLTLDIGRVARILLNVVKEFSTGDSGVLFSHVRDIITCGGLAAKRRVDGALTHPLRGIGTREGFSAANRHIWSLACTYLLYSDMPLLQETVTVSTHATITRTLRLTQAGNDFLAADSNVYYIRYPVELLHLDKDLVTGMFCPTKLGPETVAVRQCTVHACVQPHHAKGFCFNHYQSQRRTDRKRPKSAPATSATANDGFTSPAEDVTTTSPRVPLIARSMSCATTGVFEPIERAASSQGTPNNSPGPIMLQPLAHHGSMHMISPPGAVAHGLAQLPESPSPSTTDTGSDDDAVASIARLPLEGQFYPGTVDAKYMDKPPCNGSSDNNFEFDADNPYATFNSFAKQNLRGTVTAFRTTKRYKCLGVFVCTEPTCHFLYRPRITSMRKHSHSVQAPMCGNSGFHGGRDVSMVHVKCSVIFQYSLDRATNRTTLTVENFPHAHALPPPNQLAPSTKDEISSSIRSGSQPSAFRFAANSNDPAALDPRRLQHQFRSLFHDTFGSDLGIGGLGTLATLTSGKEWVRFAQPLGTTEGSFQLVFCQLTEQQELCTNVSQAFEGEDSETTAYVYTDVTYAYSDHYAQSFLTESQITGRGAVLAFCLLTRLTADAYGCSFLQFLRLNRRLWTIKNGILILKFYLIVDFSDSQRKGFLAAVKALHEMHCAETEWSTELEQSYVKHIKGCEFHYKQSVKNTAHNGSVVPHWKQSDFKTGCQSMLDAQTMADFE